MDIRANILSQHPDAVHFMNDYFLFDTGLKFVAGHSFKVDEYGFFLCLQGSSEGNIDLSPFSLRPGMLVVNVPGQLVTYQSASSDFWGTCLVMTRHFVDNLGLPYNFGLAIGIRENPILELKSGELTAIQNYCAMVGNLLQKERPYQSETLRHLTCAYAYSLGSYLYQMAEARNLSNEETIMQRFMHEVHIHYKDERKVLFYASKLNLTAGYLSTIVRNISGKTASEWIDNFVLLEAKILLRSTNMTIQQISNELNFPTQTFFGKYFKRLAGVSPKEFRDKGVAMLK